MEYMFIKGASDNAEDENYLDDQIEKQLTEIPIPATKKEKKKWLKKIICEVFHNPETVENINNTIPENRKKQLLKFVIDKIVFLIPALTSPQIKIITYIVIFLVKLILKKGIDKLCV